MFKVLLENARKANTGFYAYCYFFKNYIRFGIFFSHLQCKIIKNYKLK